MVTSTEVTPQNTFLLHEHISNLGFHTKILEKLDAVRFGATSTKIVFFLISTMKNSRLTPTTKKLLVSAATFLPEYENQLHVSSLLFI